jgi:hypothetical protein
VSFSGVEQIVVFAVEIALRKVVIRSPSNISAVAAIYLPHSLCASVAISIYGLAFDHTFFKRSIKFNHVHFEISEIQRLEDRRTKTARPAKQKSQGDKYLNQLSPSPRIRHQQMAT